MLSTSSSTFSFGKLRRRWQARAPVVTEKSLPLRVAVQVLVAIGIVATDVAAGTLTSVWAVPASAVGAAWSWRQGGQPNVGMKLGISLGMLVALGVFFAKLLGSLNDTRLVLAELLIHLQVLHSFDLPRRKDLGYSMAIGLILLGTAATLSETLAIAPLLVAFLLVALPVLVLDYRSRLGLATPWPSRWQELSARDLRGSPLAPHRVGLLLATVLGLGLLAFALLPRFPGYQLQSFPVAAPSDIAAGEFEGREQTIDNPGYVREGSGDGNALAGSLGTSPVDGPGELDSTYYYGFRDRINQNLRSGMEPQVVMRVRAQAKSFLRVLAFDTYTGQGWEISDADADAEPLSRPTWTYRFRLEQPVTSARTRDVVQTYSVVANLPNIIPAIATPQSVFFPTRQIARDGNGNLRSPTLLPDGLTYTVISRVPYRDRTRLRALPSEYPVEIRERYLQVPEAIAPLLRQRAGELLAQSKQEIPSVYERSLFLTQALKQNYGLVPDLPFLEEGEDLVEAFLAAGGGYPDHFATTLTLMLRAIGIPARLTTGFDPGNFNPFTGLYVVRNTDAYALTEVYFPNYGWLPFDPIPGREIVPPSVEDAEAFGVVRQFWNWVAGWLPSPLVALLETAWLGVIGALVWVSNGIWRFVSRGLGGAFAGAIGLLALSWVGWTISRQLRVWRYQQHVRRLPVPERRYRQMLDLLCSRGYSKHPARTPREYAREVAPHLSPPLNAIVIELCEAYSRWRYGGVEPDPDQLRQQLSDLTRGLRRLGRA